MKTVRSNDFSRFALQVFLILDFTLIFWDSLSGHLPNKIPTFWGSLVLVLCLALTLGPAPHVARAHGGGGVQQLTNAETGPYRVSVWTQPDPLEVGQIHFTVAVSEPPASGAAAGQAGPPVLGATVELQLIPAEGIDQPAVFALATHEAAVNKLFYEADVELPAASRWQVIVSIAGPAGPGSTGFEIEVFPASGINWPLFGGLGLVLLAVGWIKRLWIVLRLKRLSLRILAGSKKTVVIDMLKRGNRLTDTPSWPRSRLFPVTALWSRRWWWSTLLVLAAMAVMVRLGFWQLDRLAQRRARNTEIAHQLALPPLSLTGDESLPEDLASLKTRRVTARGEYDFSHQVALMYQNWRGSPGIHLLTPLVIEGSSQAVLVDRGWVPQVEALPAEWSQFDEPGPTMVTGFIHLSEARPQTTAGSDQSSLPIESPADTPRTEWFRVEIAAIQTQLPYELLPIYIRQSPPAGDKPNLPYQSEPEFNLTDGPHLGYAIQWYIFALILGAGYVGYVSKEVTKAVPEK